MQEVYRACRESGREFLLEIICSKHGHVSRGTVSAVIQRMYDIGVYPDWWKLEPPAGAEAMAETARTIETNDPHCRGVLLLGLAAAGDELLAGVRLAASFPVVRGFAVGRTIFYGPAKKWLNGEIDDQEASMQLRRNFVRLIDGWRDARRNL